jgi:hypothetical protein
MRNLSSLLVWGLFGTSSIALAVATTGCSSGDFDGCEADNNCKAGSGGGDSGVGGTGATGGSSGTGASGGTDGGAGVGGSSGSGGDGGGCDTSKSPSEESCLVDESYAVFVSATGSDSADGSKGTPFATIEKAMETAKAASKIVLACNDAFTAPVSLTSAHNGTKAYGGFKCSDWSYESAKKTSVTPSAEGIALKLDGVSAVHFEDFVFESKDANAPGSSSIAVFANASTNVTLRHVDIKAGKGAPGADGKLTPFTFPKQTDLNGKSAALTVGGGLKTCACPGGKQTIGGKGGDAIVPSGQAGTSGGPALGGGQPGQPGSCATTGTGSDGTAGPVTPNATGAASSGVLAAAGWTPTDGVSGVTGSPGQGGGGGASTATSGGGGGGCGGCGGAGGPAGTGGGASIGIALVDTALTLDDTVSITTSDAGKGGNGAAGQNAQAEFGFNSVGVPPACNGGNGALGAAGGAGGGAAGGVSVGILWKGTIAPVVDSKTTVATGAKGDKGNGGKPGTNDGIDGVAQPVLAAN